MVMGVLVEISADECRELISAHGVGASCVRLPEFPEFLTRLLWFAYNHTLYIELYRICW